MRLRHLRLRSITVSRVFGVDIAFESGLTHPLIQAKPKVCVKTLF